MENNQKTHPLQVTHDEHHELINENERLRAELDAVNAKYNELHDNLHRSEDAHIDEKTLIHPEKLNTILGSLNDILTYLTEMDMNTLAMTGAKRSRLLGAGVRRLGFIQKTNEIAAENPEFLQGFYTQADINNLNTQIGVLYASRRECDRQRH